MSNNYHDDSTPAVCDRCLGANPYVEMKRQRNGAECKICSAPFTVFKWNAEKSKHKGTANLKKTVICLTCARSKNCCQSCLLDLTFGVDLQTRDNLFRLAKLDNEKDVWLSKDVVTDAKNITSRLYNSRRLEEQFSNNEVSHLKDNDELKSKLEQKLEKLVHEDGAGAKRKTPDGKTFRSNEKNSNDRDLTSKDLVSLVKSFPFNGNLQSPPKNQTIKSFFFFGNTDSLSMYQIKDYFVNLSPEFNKSSVSSLYTQTGGKYGYVEFGSRNVAEKAASLIYKDQVKYADPYRFPCLIIIDNCPIRVCWSITPSMTSTNFSNEQIYKISKIVDKQLIKLSKGDSASSSGHHVVKTSKISKP